MRTPLDGIFEDESTRGNRRGGITGVIVGLIHEACQHECLPRLCAPLLVPILKSPSRIPDEPRLPAEQTSPWLNDFAGF